TFIFVGVIPSSLPSTFRLAPAGTEMTVTGIVFSEAGTPPLLRALTASWAGAPTDVHWNKTLADSPGFRSSITRMPLPTRILSLSNNETLNEALGISLEERFWTVTFETRDIWPAYDPMF